MLKRPDLSVMQQIFARIALVRQHHYVSYFLLCLVKSCHELLAASLIHSSMQYVCLVKLGITLLLTEVTTVFNDREIGLLTHIYQK